jgi:Putative translation initiation inhibitor, yjgF family
MTKESIVVKELGRAGPYAHCVVSGGFAYLSGQLGVTEDNHEDFKSQFTKALSNVERILSEIKLSKENIVRVVVYLKKDKDFPQMNELFKEAFEKVMPARTTVLCSMPNINALIELEVTASL